MDDYYPLMHSLFRIYYNLWCIFRQSHYFYKYMGSITYFTVKLNPRKDQKKNSNEWIKLKSNLISFSCHYRHVPTSHTHLHAYLYFITSPECVNIQTLTVVM